MEVISNAEMSAVKIEKRPWNFQARHLALDFANTADWHASQNPVELLESYADLVNWARDYGLLREDEARVLHVQAMEHPEEAAGALTRARATREAIYRIFRAVAHHEAPKEKDLERLKDTLARGIHLAKLAPDGKGFRWEWTFEPHAFEQMLWPITQAAVDLLRSKELLQVGQCADDRGCGLLFIDASRNHSRHWCSMEACGNRAKAQRHYRRVKSKKR